MSQELWHRDEPGDALVPAGRPSQPGTQPAPAPGVPLVPFSGPRVSPPGPPPGVIPPPPRISTHPGVRPNVPAPPRIATLAGEPMPKGPPQTAVTPPSSQNISPDSLVSRGWQSISGLMDGERLDEVDLGTGDDAGDDAGDDTSVDLDEPETGPSGSMSPASPVGAVSIPQPVPESDIDIDADMGEEPDGPDGPEGIDERDDDDDDDRDTGTPTSFERDRPLPDPDEVLIHMTQHGEAPPGRARDSAEDGTRVDATPSGDGTGSSSSGTGSGSHTHSGSLHPRRDALFGQVLADRYRVLDLIGKGGMGKVYLAEHVALGKRVAVKVLNQAYTHRPDQVKRFLREAQAASKIGHENVIDVIDFGEMPNGSVFFAMEHLQGEDLGKLLRRNGALPWSRARRILLQICRALQAAHAKGILHRDMKPENCFVIHRNGMRDFVKVLDFGIAKVLEENRQVSHTLTQAGALIGTPEYMAPEQVQGEAADVRMDIYALGCIMYQLLTGQLPFSDKTMFGVLSQQVNVRPVPPRQLAPDADIPPEVEAIILKAMEKDRALRFQTMAELIEAIVAAPRGTSDGRQGTTSNLDAAASAARIAAAMNAASAHALAATNSATPQDISLGAMGPLSGSGTAIQVASSAGNWPGAARDPQLLTKLVIGLGAAVFILLIGLVCALNRGDKPGEVDDRTTVAAVDTPATPPPVTEPVKPVTDPVVTPVITPDPTSAVVEPPKTGGDIIVDDEPEPVPGKKDPPIVKDPVTKKGTPGPKKDPGTKTPKVDTLPEPTIEKLDPSDRNKVLAGLIKDVEACRTASAAPRGSVANVKIKVDGATGKVLDAQPNDLTPAARCIAKVVKAKARFPRFKQKAPQEFNYRFQM